MKKNGLTVLTILLAVADITMTVITLYNLFFKRDYEIYEQEKVEDDDVSNAIDNTNENAGTTFTRGNMAVAGGIGIVLGALLGFGCSFVSGRRKKKIG